MKVCDICEREAPRPTKGLCVACYHAVRRGLDPYVDEVAVRRAVEGDRRVYERLTKRERDAVQDRIAVEYWRLRAEDEFHLQVQREQSGGGTEAVRLAPSYLRDWADLVGESVDNVYARVTRGERAKGSLNAAPA